MGVVTVTGAGMTKQVLIGGRIGGLSMNYYTLVAMECHKAAHRWFLAAILLLGVAGGHHFVTADRHAAAVHRVECCPPDGHEWLHVRLAVLPAGRLLLATCCAIM